MLSFAAGPTRRALHTLWAASLVGGLAQSLAGAAGALLARDIAGSDVVAGLPQALLVAGSALAALALSALTGRIGRGPALATGAATAALGCALVVGAATAGHLPGVLAGHLLLGAGNTAVMLGRYAAADLGPEESRTRAMTTVLAVTTVGAVAGPLLLRPADALGLALGLPTLVGAFLLAAGGFAATAVLLGRRPLGPFRAYARRATATTDAAPGAPAATTGPVPAAGGRAGGPGLGRAGTVGLVVLSLANLVMVAVMTMGPVHLSHLGVGLAAIGLVVSAHIAGMFAPSPVSGWLTDRIGSGSAAAVAGVLLCGAGVLAALRAADPAVLVVALVLLGVGWNLALVAGSTLLTAGVPPGERPRREGWGEIGMGVAAAGGGAVSGSVVAGGGYALLAGCGAVVAALLVPTSWIAHRPIRRGRPEEIGAA